MDQMHKGAALDYLIYGSDADFFAVVEVLPRELDRELMRLHLRERKSWTRIAELLHYDRTYLIHRYQRALKRIEAAMFPSFPGL